MKIKSFKVFGERHTGTNVISSFIETNFNIERKDYEYLGWKHRIAPEVNELNKYDLSSNFFVITFRNPYSWFKAMHKEPYNISFPKMKKISFNEFLELPFEDYENVVTMWNKKISSYLNFINDNNYLTLSINIEVFNKNQKKIFDDLIKILNLEKDSVLFKPEYRYLNGWGHQAKKDVDKSLLMPTYQNDELLTVNKYIDKELLAELSYVEPKII